MSDVVDTQPARKQVLLQRYRRRNRRPGLLRLRGPIGPALLGCRRTKTEYGWRRQAGQPRALPM